jgi:N utilization substance protein B
LSARSKARKRALDLIYASEMRGRSALDALDEQSEVGQVNDYTIELVRGVTEHRARLDEVISSYAQGWTLDRMPAVDRNVLRLGVYELMYADDVPDGVAVTEAMNLVRDLSTDESPAFVNGVLGTILRTR